MLTINERMRIVQPLRDPIAGEELARIRWRVLPHGHEYLQDEERLGDLAQLHQRHGHCGLLPRQVHEHARLAAFKHDPTAHTEP